MATEAPATNGTAEAAAAPAPAPAAAAVAKKEDDGGFMDIVTDPEAGKTVAYVIHGAKSPASTKFLTPGDENPQVGYIVYPKDHKIPRHYHNPVERTVFGTPEVLFIRSGSVRADLYDFKQKLLRQETLVKGDVLILVGGGHGFEILEEGTVMMEVKQGPYAGAKDKVHF